MKRLLLLLVLACTVPVSAQIRLGGSTEPSSVIHTQSFATLAALLSAVGSTPTDVVADSTVAVSANETIPATVTLKVIAPGRFVFTNSAILTINGSFTTDPRYQAFSGTGGPAFACGGTQRLSPYWWGLDSDGTDITRALQASIDALPDCGGTIVIPSSPALGVNILKPIHVNRSHVEIRGENQRDTTLINSYLVGGPAFFVGSDLPAFPTEAALATGTGSAFTLAAGYGLNLSDAGTVELNTLAAFTAECYVKFSSLAAGNTYYVLSSRAKLLDGDTTAGAFELAANTTGGGGTEKIVGKLRVGSTYYTLTGTTIISTGATYHVAMTYDGSNIRLFVDGNLEDTEAATGTVTQRSTEDVRLGLPTVKWPDVPDSDLSALGAVDSVRLSSTARYVSAFTAPTAKFTGDVNTLILCNFTEQIGQITSAYTNVGTAYLVLRRNTNLNFLTKVTIRDLQINGKHNSSGIFVFSGNDCKFANLDIQFTRIGLYMFSSSFLNHVTDFRGLAGNVTRFMLSNCLSSGVNYYEHVNIAGGVVPFIGSTGSLVLTNSYITVGPTSLYGMLFTAADDTTITLINPNISDEGVDTGVGRAGLAFTNVLAASVQGGTIFFRMNDSPSVANYSGGQTQLTFTGTQFEVAPLATEAVNLTGTVPATLTLVGPYTNQPTIPWSNNPGSTMVLGRGVQYPNRTVTTTYAVKVSDYTIRGDATGGAFSGTLPTAVGVAGKRYIFKKIDSSGNAFTVATTSSQTIDGSTTKVLATQWATVALESDGANWIIVGN